jgi:predicted transcriptional regulator of viral defense system
LRKIIKVPSKMHFFVPERKKERDIEGERLKVKK